jgi:hypothetical protein
LNLLRCRREASFTSPLPEDEPQDYEHDAIVVHMGRFAAETPLPPGQPDEDKAASEQQQQGRKGKLALKRHPIKAGAEVAAEVSSTANGTADCTAAAGPPAGQKRGKSEPNLELLFVGSRVQRTQSSKQGAAASRSKVVQLQVQQLHLYSIASPGMRRWPDTTQDLGAALAWAEPVNMKPGWAQLQKGFFQAPGGGRQLASIQIVL